MAPEIVLGVSERARFIPTYRELRYTGYILLFGLISSLYFTLVEKILESFDFGPHVEAEATLIAFILSSLLFALLFKRFILVLPRLSVEEKGFVFPSGLAARATKGFVWPMTLCLVVIITGMLPYLVGALLFLELSSLRETAGLDLLSVLVVTFGGWIILVAYCSLVFATLLSLFYREKLHNLLLQHNAEIAN